ncbi:MAG: hypothetical protein WD490_07045 [Opitutales bacterium]
MNSFEQRSQAALIGDVLGDGMAAAMEGWGPDNAQCRRQIMQSLHHKRSHVTDLEEMKMLATVSDEVMSVFHRSSACPRREV